MKNYKTELLNWAEEVINKFTPWAEKFNIDYYPLQSKAKENPEYLIIGLNPGGGNTYNSQKGNRAWQFVNSKMTVERLLKGNPYFGYEKDKWSIIQGLNKIPFCKDVLEKEDYCFINYFYFQYVKELKNQRPTTVTIRLF